MDSHNLVSDCSVAFYHLQNKRQIPCPSIHGALNSLFYATCTSTEGFHKPLFSQTSNLHRWVFGLPACLSLPPSLFSFHWFSLDSFFVPCTSSKAPRLWWQVGQPGSQLSKNVQYWWLNPQWAHWYRIRQEWTWAGPRGWGGGGGCFLEGTCRLFGLIHFVFPAPSKNSSWTFIAWRNNSLLNDIFIHSFIPYFPWCLCSPVILSFLSFLFLCVPFSFAPELSTLLSLREMCSIYSAWHQESAFVFLLQRCFSYSLDFQLLNHQFSNAVDNDVDFYCSNTGWSNCFQNSHLKQNPTNGLGWKLHPPGITELDTQRLLPP